MPRESTVLRCPNCGSTEVGSNDLIPGTAGGQWVLPVKGKRTFEASGYTKVGWDGQEPVKGEEAICTDCFWIGSPDDLVLPPDDVDDDLDELDGGDGSGRGYAS